MTTTHPQTIIDCGRGGGNTNGPVQGGGSSGPNGSGAASGGGAPIDSQREIRKV